MKYDPGDFANNEKATVRVYACSLQLEHPDIPTVAALPCPPVFQGQTRHCLPCGGLFLARSMLQDFRINLGTMKHEYFDTPFHAVSKRRHYDLVYELLQHGADPNEGTIL